MELTNKLLTELQRRLKIGNRRGVHLNAIPANSRYKFDLNRLSYIDKDLPNNFLKALLSELPLKFKISWKDNVPDLNSLFEEDQSQLVRITKAFENLINQTEAIEAEKGINTFGFGFPILARRDRSDNKLTVAPILIWSLRIKRTKEFNTWEILRNEDDPIYINEVLINHLQSDANIEIEQIPNEMLDDGHINKSELIQICSKLIRSLNTTCPDNLEETFAKKLNNIISIGDKGHYDKLPLNSSNSFIDFGGLFSIFEVQKQNIIIDYDNLLELEGLNINLGDLEGNSFQPISAVDTDPSQQSILHSLDVTRNILIQGPPGTGKSQTLTAVLINALENNRKTIVVCEKRTALEVLHNALIERGLNYHCVLIRDIVKDRKTVVDSVRDRVDNLEYKRYRYNYSKETLDILIEKAKKLIESINTKHLKLDENLLGNKKWSDIVGELLKEIKGIDESLNLSIDKKSFNYSSTELNSLLDVVEKGQVLYQEFLPVEKLCFINSNKLIGENPYKIEEDINEDFALYDGLIKELKEILQLNRNEYFSLREEELKKQINLITSSINDVLNKDNAFQELILLLREKFISFRSRELQTQINNIYEKLEELYLTKASFEQFLNSSKEEYFKFRTREFLNQTARIDKTIESIDIILQTNEGNFDLLDETKVNSFAFKTLALFSSKKKQTIIDHLGVKENFLKFNVDTYISRDIPDFKNEESLSLTAKSLEHYKKVLLKTKTSFSDKVEKEFDSFQFKESLKHIDIKDALRLVDLKIQNSKEFDEFEEFLKNLKSKYEQYLQKTHNKFAVLYDLLLYSKDVNLRYSSSESIEKQLIEINKIPIDLKQISADFNIDSSNEFDLFKLDSARQTDGNFQIFNLIQAEIENGTKSTFYRDELQEIWQIFKKYIQELKGAYKSLRGCIEGSEDINFMFKLDQTFKNNKVQISELQAKLQSIETGFSLKVESEFNKINLLNTDSGEVKIYSLKNLQKKCSELETKLEADKWTRKKINLTDFDKFIKDVEKIIIRKEEYFTSDDDLFSVEFKWFQFYNSLSILNQKIIDELKTKDNWKKYFLSFYLNSLLVNSANIDLPVNEYEHNELDKTLSVVGKEQLNFIKEYWYSKQIDSKRDFEQKNINLSVENLYNKRSSNRYKRLSLRQIVQYDADLFTNFFPIILTSPDVASNLFKGMNGYFDIVMFDEASQLRLEDNLPAILKGKQIIIAGDEHQMPPSNYFSKLFDGTIEDEDDLEEEEVIKVDKDNILLSCESLLDFGSELNFERKHLDFHYRSRHPFLIDFSNYAFYNQRLKPLPNNFDYTPIKYIQVNGTFSEHTNEAEAEMVLSIIEKNINKLPNGEYPTVGIATFNIAQRNLIKSKILERQKFSKFDAFNSKIQELEENGMFIKNLENIQGDERDVIILSTTYGIGKDRKVSERFGPINHSKGYKLLNVIITRAKYKLYCVTSIPESKFMNFKDYLLSDGSNTKSGKASFFAYIAYCKAISESNNDLRLSILTALAENTTKSVGFDSFKGGDLESPFEEEVYQSLADNFGVDNLIPQMQFAGFRIDIVYDYKIAGIPKIAIECDGAKYHSSREAYLHDRHRQKILEEHGFVFHRIWSTNWWRNPTRETKKLVDFIRQYESEPKIVFDDYSDTAFAFTDDVDLIDVCALKAANINIATENETIKVIEHVNNSSEKESDKKIELNSKVQVKYVNNGNNVNIQIVSTEKNKKENGEEYQKIYFKSPLANSLLGQTVGKIVKIGNLDNFVEILHVHN